MLVAFLVVTVPLSAVLGAGVPYRADLAAMILGQVALGAAMGLIYAASLYFGMVLSAGSTAHGGYHEALIGLGSVLGPGAGAATQAIWPGNVWAPVAAVAALVAISVVAAATVSVRARRG